MCRIFFIYCKIGLIDPFGKLQLQTLPAYFGNLFPILVPNKLIDHIIVGFVGLGPNQHLHNFMFCFQTNYCPTFSKTKKIQSTAAVRWETQNGQDGIHIHPMAGYAEPVLGREGWCIPGLDLISTAVFPIKGLGFSDHCHGPWQILLIQMQSLHAASLILEVTLS